MTYRVALLLPAVLALGALGVSQMRPADPVVERSTLWIDSVRRGEQLGMPFRKPEQK